MAVTPRETMTTQGQTSRALLSPGVELTAAILSRQRQPAAGLGAELCGLTSPQTTLSSGCPVSDECPLPEATEPGVTTGPSGQQFSAGNFSSLHFTDKPRFSVPRRNLGPTE